MKEKKRKQNGRQGQNDYAKAEFANEALKKSKVKVTIDHRSYKRQGLTIKPSIKLGIAAHQMEKRGIRTERGNIIKTLCLRYIVNRCKIIT